MENKKASAYKLQNTTGSSSQMPYEGYPLLQQVSYKVK